MADRVGVLVWVTAPPGMEPRQVRHEVLSCISFGRPEAQLLFVIEEPGEQPDPVG